MSSTEDAKLPDWCRLVRADNPGPMTLEGTNTYVLATDAGNIVVDPGPIIDEHLRAIMALGPVTLTVLTHHHRDHSASAARFHELTGAPVVAFDPALCVGDQRLPDDGEVFDVSGLELRVLHTPGHTADSVCLEASRSSSGSAPTGFGGSEKGLLTGDTILGRGTTTISHPDGRLGDYLDSLERLSARLDAECTLLPAHGPVRADAAAVVTEYIAHRQARLDEVRSALAAGAASPREVVEIVYADVDRSVWPAAERTVAATLDYLAESR